MIAEMNFNKYLGAISLSFSFCSLEMKVYSFTVRDMRGHFAGKFPFEVST